MAHSAARVLQHDEKLPRLGASGAARVMLRFNDGLALVEGAGIFAFLAALTLLATWQFVARNLRPLGVEPAPFWVDSVIRHAVFFIGFLGAAFATYMSKHLRVDAVTRGLSPRARLVARLVTTVFAAAVCGLLAKGGYEFYADVVAFESGDVTQTDEVITTAMGSLAMPAGFGLVLWHLFVQLVVDALWLVSGEPIPASLLADAHEGEGLYDPEAHDDDDRVTTGGAR